MRKKALIPIFIFVMLCAASYSHAQIKLKFIVLNASEEERKEIPFKQYLPQEVKPEHIVDAGGMEVKYDVDMDAHYIFGKVELDPKESRIFKVEIQDIWKIPNERLKALRKQSSEKLMAMTGTQSYTIAKNLKDSIWKRLNDIEIGQDADIPIAERIEVYRLNEKRLSTVENDVFVLEALATEAEKKEGDIKTVTTIIQIENPSLKHVYEGPAKYYLPPEVNIGDVIESAGFNVRYDVERSMVYLTRDVKLGPNESKKYAIVLRDVWHIKELELKWVETETDKVTKVLADTPSEKMAGYLGDRIKEVLEQIRSSEKLELPLKDRIGVYRENVRRLETANEYLERLKRLMLQYRLARAGSPRGEKGGGTTEATSKTERVGGRADVKTSAALGGGKAEGKGGGIGRGLGTAIGKGRGSSKEARGGGIKAIRGLKGIILVSKSLFKGWKPTIATTWSIILFIIGFLGVFAATFYAVWLAKVQREKKKKPFLE